MDTLTATTLAEVLKEPEKVLLGRILKAIGQERCQSILADTLALEANGGMLTRDGTRRRTPGGVFLQLAKDRSSGKQRYYLFTYPKKQPQRPAARPGAIVSSGAAVAPAPVARLLRLTLSLWKGLRPMPVTATLKLVLRDLPETREKDGMVYMALHHAPKGLPKNISLDAGPLYLTAPGKQWRAACTKAEQIRATGIPALIIAEAHVSTRENALIGVIKTLQVVEGKAAVAPSA